MTDRIPFPEHAWPLMRKALEHIAGHPDEFYMPDWILRVSDLDPDVSTDRNVLKDVILRTGRPLPQCGTVACLAGHIILAAGDTTLPENDIGALGALGIERGSDAGQMLWLVFGFTSIKTYAELREALEARFTFPEPLPAPEGVSS